MNSPSLEAQLRVAFAEESEECVERIAGALLALEHAVPSERHGYLQTVRRELHTLKGAASTVEASSIQRLCHMLEDALESIALEADALLATKLDALHRGLRCILLLVANPTHPELVVVADLLEATFQLGASQSRPPSLANSGHHSEQTGNHRERSIEKRHADGSIRVRRRKVDGLEAAAAELIVLQLQEEERRHQASVLRDELSTLLSSWRSLWSELRELERLVPAKQWRRLEHRSSTISSLVGSVYGNSYELAEWSVRHAGQLSLISQTLDEGLRDIRMQPIGPLLESFGPGVREAARASNKEVRFTYSGSSVEIDRFVMERIREPLLHLVRNAVAHGIELPTERQVAGKPRAGSVHVRATLLGQSVHFEVSDDGRGIDKGAVRDKARALGLHTSQDMTNEDIFHLLAHPGFSTAESVSELAGRGVGMDVVDSVINELGGSSRMTTEQGQGTVFGVTVPTSITTSRGIVVQAGPFRLGFLLDAVERILRIKESDIETIEDSPVLYHEGRAISIARLLTILGATGYAAPPDAALHPVVVLRAGKQRLAVVVDEIHGEIPMMLKSLGEQFAGIPHLSGAAIQSDGAVLPVLEHRELLRMASGKALQPFSSMQKNEPSEHSSELLPSTTTILVVDDSLTTRTLERNILEAAGFRVLTATDGAQALDILRSEPDVQLVVTDLEMPRMNGLELCQSIRQSERAQLPVIIVTSRGTEEEQRQGMEAGADAYIVKGNFQQEHFMKTVKRFVA